MQEKGWSFVSSTICPASGLNLVASAGQSIFRVARTQYGAVNPPPRVPGRDPVEGWSRWDTPGRTVYGCVTAVGAFVEVLEYIRPDPPSTPLSELFDDVDVDDTPTLATQIAQELPRHGAMPYRSIPQAWRQIRSLHELRLPREGWFVDICGAESISVLSEQLGSSVLAQCGIEHLTLSELTSSAGKFKALTTGVATWVRDSVQLFDGHRPHGIVYPSKWGSSLTNVAMWLRRNDDQTGADDIEVLETTTIGLHTRSFVDAAKLRGMKTF